MGDKSKIEWTDATWNPIVGCSIVSPGCTNCYAMKFAGNRLDGNPKAAHYAGTTQKSKAGPVWSGKLALAPDHILTAPLRWKKPRTIFVNSMGDLFHENCPDEWIDRVFAVMALAPQHTFQVLTKRAERMHNYVAARPTGFPWERAARNLAGQSSVDEHEQRLMPTSIWRVDPSRIPLPNVWLGVSAEDQRRAEERIPLLLDTRAAVRFASVEPMLGAIELQRLRYLSGWMDALAGYVRGGSSSRRYEHCRLDWVIVGGESGPNARPMHPDWARSLRDQCEAASVPYFFKQWGEWKEAFHDQDGPIVNEVDNESDEADALLAALQGKPGWLHRDGRFFLQRSALPEEEPVRLMERLGKHRAGRLLDGREHNDMPEVRR
jgi:protein gp37